MASVRQSVLLILAALSITARAQTPQPTAPFDPKAAVTEALHRLQEADSAAHRYTYIEKITMATVGRSGRLIDGTTRKYEALFLNDHQYLKLLEVDDLPLAGSALRDEQKRYDKAVAKKKELDKDKRADSDGFVAAKPDFELAYVLMPSYTLKEVSTQKSAGGDTLHVVEATLVPGTKHKSKCPWHARLWISEKSGTLTRYVADIVEKTSEECEATAEEKRYILVDGLPKLSAEVRRLNYQDSGFAYVPHEYLIAFTDYRRFHATVTLGEATELPNENSPAPPPDPTK